jgi:hypothetical protein
LSLGGYNNSSRLQQCCKKNLETFLDNKSMTNLAPELTTLIEELVKGQQVLQETIIKVLENKIGPP